MALIYVIIHSNDAQELNLNKNLKIVLVESSLVTSVKEIYSTLLALI